MKRIGHGLMVAQVLGLVSLGWSPTVAGQEPKRGGEGAEMSPSLGPVRTLEYKRVSSIKFSRDGRRISAALPRAIAVWNGETGLRLKHIENPPEQWLLDLACDDSGLRIVTGGMFDLGYTKDLFRAHRVKRGSLAKLWDGGSGEMRRTLVLDESRYFQMATISREGTRVACVDGKLNFKLWEADTGRELAAVVGPIPEPAESLSGSFSGDATRFASLVDRPGQRKGLFLCDLAAQTTREVSPLADGRSGFGLAAISEGGWEVAVWVLFAPEQEITIFDFATGGLRSRLRVPECANLSYLAFSPDGRTIAFGKEDGHLGLVDRASGASIARFRVSDGPVRAVVFLPDRVRVVAERKVVQDTGMLGNLRLADYAVQWSP